MSKAIVMDLDDTLLRYDKTISDFTIRTLKACSASGIKLIYATARGESAQRLTPQNLFAGRIQYNGATACVNGEMIYNQQIEAIIYRPFLQKMNQLNLRSSAEIDGTQYSNYDVPAKWEWTSIRSDFTDVSEPAEKLVIRVDTPADAEQITRHLPEQLYAHFTKDSLALIMSKKATKLQALSAVLQHMGIDFSEVIAFGDDINDMEMLAACGIGVAMANALDEVKQIANQICGDCDNDGVAHHLAALFPTSFSHK